jgi:transcriptional regulator GlxA family with amidase domain/predicted N-acetyltransferase YhbS
MERMQVGILIYPDVEVLDFCGPYEVFSTTRLDEARRREEPSPFEVFLVAGSREPVAATGGMRVLPDHDFDTCPALDALVVPGGWGSRAQVHNERLVGWMRRQAAGVRWLTSVCTGSFLLGQAGLLEGRRATTHWASLDRMRQTFPGVSVEDRLHVVEDGNVLTSAGISAGIDLALRLVARTCGEAVGRATARHMEYPYPEGNERRVAVRRDAPAIEVTDATGARDLEVVLTLFQEYAASLDFNLCFQDFEQELAELPGDYAPPGGCLLLARVAGEVAGCVALRHLEAGIGEMKRLYLRPAYRGHRLGRRLVEEVLRRATTLGYGCVRLDTVPAMAAAIRLYRSLGFREIPPYRANPVPGATYLELRLTPEALKA